MGYKRGDGVVFVRTDHVMMIGQPSYERQSVVVGEVTSVTRDGQIKAFRNLSWSGPGAQKIEQSSERYATRYAIPKDAWNMAAIADYMADRPWSHAPDKKGMPFDSLEQCREELKRFRSLVGSPTLN